MFAFAESSLLADSSACPFPVAHGSLKLLRISAESYVPPGPIQPKRRFELHESVSAVAFVPAGRSLLLEIDFGRLGAEFGRVDVCKVRWAETAEGHCNRSRSLPGGCRIQS